MISTYQTFFFSFVLLLGAIMSMMSCKNSSPNTDVASTSDSLALKIAADSLKTVFLEEVDSIEKKMPSKAGSLNDVKTLEDYLPYLEELETVGKPKVERGDIQGNKFVQVTQLYKNATADASISIIDYGNNSKMYAMATTVLRYSSDNEDGSIITEAYNAEDADLVGRTVYDSNKREASALLGVANRFFISAQATNQKNANLVKNLLDNIDLDAIKSLEEE